MTPKQKDMRLQAESHYEAQEWADAERLFHALSKQMEPDGNFLHDRAVCLFQLGRKTEALSLLDRAVDLEPDTGYRYASRAWMRAAMKDVDGAIEDYRKAIEIDPEDAITLNNLGLLEEQYGMRKAAQERFRRADTLSGILREAGVNPPGTDEDPGPQENEKSNVWTEIKTVFTDAGRRREFLNFIKNGMRL
ncbi:MAG: hypothetical protein CL849_02955 [Crocinitomicaceae bacterium]|nr:hypothetical protein [Crocinitomicaceae bacterium]